MSVGACSVNDHMSNDSHDARDQGTHDSQSGNEPVYDLGLGAAWDLQQEDVSQELHDQGGSDSQSTRGRETHDADGRVMSLGIDSAGGFAVPYQLDGKKPRKPKKR